MTKNHNSSINETELNKFHRTTKEWWDPFGEFKTLHQINPVRIEYIRRLIETNFEKRLKDLTLLDVGCGGGLASIPLAKIGLNVHGIDASGENVASSNERALQEGLNNAKYTHQTAEELADSTSEQYDVVLSLEVLEHVDNTDEFITNLTKLVKPGGLLILSTINRTAKSYLFAIVMAEYILRWVPIKTHDHAKFIKPSEIKRILDKANRVLSKVASDREVIGDLGPQARSVHMIHEDQHALSTKQLSAEVEFPKSSNVELIEMKGLSLNLVTQSWYLSDDIDVNYFLVARK